MNDLVNKTSDGEPSVDAIFANKFLSLDPRFTLECAMGMEDISEIASRYGFTPEDVEKLKRYQPFLIELERMKGELQRSGQNFKMKAALMSDLMMEKVFQGAMQGNASLAVKIDALKTLTKLADLEPKGAQTQSAGAGFSITINLGERKEVIEVKGGENA